MAHRRWPGGTRGPGIPAGPGQEQCTRPQKGWHGHRHGELRHPLRLPPVTLASLRVMPGKSRRVWGSEALRETGSSRGPVVPGQASSAGRAGFSQVREAAAGSGTAPCAGPGAAIGTLEFRKTPRWTFPGPRGRKRTRELGLPWPPPSELDRGRSWEEAAKQCQGISPGTEAEKRGCSGTRARPGPSRGARGADTAPERRAPRPPLRTKRSADPQRGYVAARTWVRGAALGSALTGGGSLFSAECERNKILLKGR